MKAFVVARRHAIAACAHPGVMHQQMLGAKMRIEHRGEQEIGQPALEPVGLVQKLMGIDDPDRPREHANAEEDAELFPAGEVAGPGHIPDRAVDQHDLDRQPDPGDQLIPQQPGIAGFGIGVVAVAAENGIERGVEPPCPGGRQDERPATIGCCQPDQRQQQERNPIRHGAAETCNLRCRNHGATSLLEASIAAAWAWLNGSRVMRARRACFGPGRRPCASP